MKVNKEVEVQRDVVRSEQPVPVGIVVATPSTTREEVLIEKVIQVTIVRVGVADLLEATRRMSAEDGLETEA